VATPRGCAPAWDFSDKTKDILGKRVLIADDEPNIVISLEFLLSRAGFEVASVANGEDALVAILRNRPDVLLLDVMLPGRDGFEVCQAIRQDPAFATLKIVMLTAKGRAPEVTKGLALGADAYVTKPFATRELVETVKRLADEV
jgi:DNA-binding response OmpR family regulator